jgi:hypothetical protein
MVLTPNAWRKQRLDSALCRRSVAGQAKRTADIAIERIMPPSTSWCHIASAKPACQNFDVVTGI